MSDLPREVVKLHVGGRIAIPKRFRLELNLKEGDLILVQLYNGKLIVEALDRRLKP